MTVLSHSKYYHLPSQTLALSTCSVITVDMPCSGTKNFWVGLYTVLEQPNFVDDFHIKST